MIEIILDASQLDVFEACPRKWYYQYVRNLIPLTTSKALSKGSYYHEVLAFFYGLPLGPAQFPTTRPNKDLWQQLILKINKPITDYNQRIQAAISFAASVELQKKFNINDFEEQQFHRKRVIDYIYKWSNEDEYMTPIAIEQGFSWLLYEDSRRRYILEGKVDLINYCKPYGLNVMDHKTQSRYDNRWEFNHQVCNYLSYMKKQGKEADYFVYNYIGLQDKLPAEGLRRMIYRPHAGMLEQWQTEVRNTFDQMYEYMSTYYNKTGWDTNIIPWKGDYPRRRAACDSSKYGLCPYHKLCSVPDDSRFAGAVQSAYKEKEERWTPWT